MTAEEFLLADRIAKIKSIDAQEDLSKNGYISFSGGKDSIVLHYLMDEALPNNTIPRLFINTGMELSPMLKFVKQLASKDNRIVVLNVGKNIPETLAKVGYPFKSKEHSDKVSYYQHSGIGKTVKAYLGEGRFTCPDKLRYQFTDAFTLKISKRCCDEFKKKPAEQWRKTNNRPVAILGLRASEGGTRKQLSRKGCFFFDNKHKRKVFNPLFVCDDSWIEWYITSKNIKLADLYYPPYNFKRTGCKGCPYVLKLQEQLDAFAEFLPADRYSCEHIWKPVYDEYRRIGYRLNKDIDKQLN